MSETVTVPEWLTRQRALAASIKTAMEAALDVRRAAPIDSDVLDMLAACAAQTSTVEANSAAPLHPSDVVTVGLVGDGEEIPDDVHISYVPNSSLLDVQLWDVRPGDLIHVTFRVADVDEGAIIDIPKDWSRFGADMFEVPFSAATGITRRPPPKAPGSRGDAKVRGKLRTTVVRAGNPVGHQQWMSATPVEGESWHADCDITEYVPEGER
jgi:hypothetical protein